MEAAERDIIKRQIRCIQVLPKGGKKGGERVK
jgi:hypothetical protein